MTTIALAQINLMVGDIAANARQVIACAERLRDSADIIVFPELTLTGYPPEDLLLRPECDVRVADALRESATSSSKPARSRLASSSSTSWIRSASLAPAAPTAVTMRKSRR